MYKKIEYKVSDAELTAEWKKNGYGHSYICTNCHHYEDAGYPSRSFELGTFCPNCGFRMRNPQYVIIEYDYD